MTENSGQIVHVNNTNGTNHVNVDHEHSYTYKKREGTGNLGLLYEDIRVVQTVIDLLNAEDVVDFKVWANDEKYGNFDDVTVIFERRKKGGEQETVRIAIQLKHAKDNQKKNSLETFSDLLKKLFTSYQKAKQNNAKLSKYFLLLQTNSLKSEIQHDLQICMGDYSLRATIIEKPPESHYICRISEAKPLKFIIQNNAVSDEIRQFWDQFYFYPSQLDWEKTHERNKSKFEDYFSIDLDPFFKFLQTWSLQDGEKYKLTKDWISFKVVECLITPSWTHLKMTDAENSDLFKKITDQFDATLLIKDDYPPVLERIWSDEKSRKKAEKEDKVNYFQMTEITEPSKDLLRDYDFSEVLNLKYNRPLVATLDQDNIAMISKAMSMYKSSKKKKKFIFVANSKCTLSELLQEHKGEMFQNADDLQIKDPGLFNEVAEKLNISLQGKEPVPLGGAVEDKTIRNCLTASHILHMLETSLPIGENQEQLPHYLSRTITNFIIDFQKFLLKINPNENAVLICSSDDLSKAQDKCDVMSHNRINFKFCNASGKDGSFEQLCRNNSSKKCHCLEYCAGEETFKWLESNKSIEDLRECHEEAQSLVREESLETTEDYLLNIICDESGMGKTWFLKRLKTRYPSMMVIEIDANKGKIFDTEATAEELTDLLSVVTEKRNELESAIFKFLYSEGRILILWDALDKVSSGRLPNALKAIDHFKTEGLYQWITSGPLLQKELENRFHVLSRRILGFNKEQQKEYIKQKLDENESTLSLENFINYVQAKVEDIFQSPQHLYMLTELSQDTETNILEQLKGGNFSKDKLHQLFSGYNDRIRIRKRQQ